MKKGYRYQDKIRKEVWLSESVIKKLIKKFKIPDRDLKRTLERIIEEAAN